MSCECKNIVDIKIIVATHKKYWIPKDGIYLPLQVGAEEKSLDLGIAKDNTGENISSKNKNYCELTALYWAWKNLDAAYIGLVHYRRHFCVKKIGIDKKKRVLTGRQLENLIKKNDVLLPRQRNYFVETNYSQYAHAHHAKDLDVTREILQEKYPVYVKAFDETMKLTKGHRFNMFIMKKDKFDTYCEWLFDVLFELERRLDISDYSENDARVFGFVSERLLDVWIRTNQIAYKDISYVFMEKQNCVVKGANFLKRKLHNSDSKFCFLYRL